MKIMSNELEMKYRLFKIMAMTAVIANSIGFISNVMIFGMNISSAICMISAGVMAAMALIGWRSRYWNLCMLIILLTLNCLEFPYLFYAYGCRTIVYMVLGFCGAIIYAERKYRNVLAAAIMVYDSMIIAVVYQFNKSYWVLSAGEDMMSTICSLLIVLASLYAIIALWAGFNKNQNAELVELNDKLRHISESDALTGAYNRHFLTKYLERLIKQPDTNFYIVLIDIDNFKHVNDTYGHIVGDNVLVELCTIIKAKIGENDVLARFGGEEFLIIFRDLDRTAIEEKLQQVAVEFWQYGMSANNEGLSFSGGVAEYRHEDELTKLYNNADEKLYTAKRNGKNQIIW